jgi:hypothetical protein
MVMRRSDRERYGALLPHQRIAKKMEQEWLDDGLIEEMAERIKRRVLMMGDGMNGGMVWFDEASPKRATPPKRKEPKLTKAERRVHKNYGAW